jgi:hypothetical protein
MVKKLAIGALGGGVVFFLWGVVSWMVLPFREASLNKFTEEDAVAAAVQANAPRPGIYFYPGTEPNLPREQRQAAQEAAMAKMEQGTVLFVSYSAGRSVSMARPMVTHFVMLALASLIITWTLLQTRGLSYWGRVGLVILLSFAASLVAVLPNWNWWGFSTAYVWSEVLDLLIGGLLAGLVIAWATAGQEAGGRG